LADAVRIREVLVNILGNAVKFTNDGGRITFEASYLPGEDARHIVAHYRVADTGVGMSEEFVGHIFDEFSQEESSARTQYKGTGLGMAITKRYVDLMGGTIRVQSEKGKGSTFIVELPMELTDESGVQKREYSAGSSDLTGVKVLLAEDNELNAEIATIQLEELGVQVTRVSDGRQAVQAFAGNAPGTFDLILMDIMMPEMDGYAATAAIRGLPSRPDARDVPIIAMTANAFAEDVQASLDAGMNGHLSKPIVMDEVVKTIARNLEL
ncbi:MAG: ATP-binding protein, partial [Candidatus Spyradocola sp.]